MKYHIYRSRTYPYLWWMFCGWCRRAGSFHNHEQAVDCTDTHRCR